MKTITRHHTELSSEIAVGESKLNKEYKFETPIADHVVGILGNEDQAIDTSKFDFQFFTKSGNQIKSYCDDSSAEFYYVSNEFGVCFIVQANGEASAWDCFLDESKPIEASELWEAYGFDSEEEYNKADLNNEEGNWPDLDESYQYQPNSTGTGIVNVGHYTSHPSLLTISELKRLEINLVIQLGE